MHFSISTACQDFSVFKLILIAISEKVMMETPTIEMNYDKRFKCRNTGRICQILFMRNCHSERIFLKEGSSLKQKKILSEWQPGPQALIRSRKPFDRTLELHCRSIRSRRSVQMAVMSLDMVFSLRVRI